MREHSIGGIPIVDDSGKLIGIITNRDLRFEHERMHDCTEQHAYAGSQNRQCCYVTGSHISKINSSAL